MTTISSATQIYSPQSTQHAHSGKNRMAEAIAQQQQSGALSSTDATALTSALSSIDSSLQDGASSTSATGGTSTASTTSSDRLDPSQMKDRIDSLISDQVSNGSLTSDQATELKNLFSSHGTSVTSGTDTDGARGGPPPGPPPSDSTADTSATGSSSSSSSDLLASFIKQLQSAQTATSYGAGGINGSQQSAALLFDFQS